MAVSDRQGFAAIADRAGRRNRSCSDNKSVSQQATLKAKLFGVSVALLLFLTQHNVAVVEGISDTPGRPDSSDEFLPKAVFILPEQDETMLSETGSFQLSYTMYRWTSGAIRVKVNETLVVHTSEGHMEESETAGIEMSWEIYGFIPGHTYVASIEFFDAETGQVVSGSSRATKVLPYRDPFEDPPELEIVFPVTRGHASYPTVQGERAQLHVRTKDLAPVRAGQALVLLVNNGISGFYGRMNQLNQIMHFPPDSYRRMCPLVVPQMLVAALFTSDGADLIAASEPTLFWAGAFSEEERSALPSLAPLRDNGSLAVLYPAPTFWTQAKRPPPRQVLDDGSLGPPDPDPELPVMGFLAREHPEGFQPGEDFEAIGYEPPPPGEFGQLWMRAPEGLRVTVVITSCGRIPGLRRTIHSLLAANTYPVDRYLIVEDSGDWRVAEKLIEEFGDVFDVLVNKKRMGQLFSVDKAYRSVQTEYIFHCEDDWVFNGIPHFIRDSVSILEYEPKAFTVHISNTSFLYPIDDFINVTPEGAEYQRILNPRLNAKNWGDNTRFYAFSFHPGLRRKSDYDNYLNPMQAFFQEDNINSYLFWKGFYMVKLPERYCNHLDINSISRHMEYHIEHMGAEDTNAS